MIFLFEFKVPFFLLKNISYFGMVPSLYEMTRQVAGTLTKHNKSLVSPWHAMRFRAVKLISRIVSYILKVFYVAIRVVLAVPIVALLQICLCNLFVVILDFAVTVVVRSWTRGSWRFGAIFCQSLKFKVNDLWMSRCFKNMTFKPLWFF